jgi:hypothetical protein
MGKAFPENTQGYAKECMQQRFPHRDAHGYWRNAASTLAHQLP